MRDTYVGTDIRKYIDTYTLKKHAYTPKSTYSNRHMYVHIYMYDCINRCIPIHAHAHAHVNEHVHAHVHVQGITHMHIHVHTRTQT